VGRDDDDGDDDGDDDDDDDAVGWGIVQSGAGQRKGPRSTGAMRGSTRVAIGAI
jgi:hypothetical protein